MNREVKAEWVEALRSGQYRQGANYLRKNNGQEDEFCCLGVLCEIAVEHGAISEPLRKASRIYSYALGEMQVLPQSVVEWAGLPDDNPTIGRSGVRLTGLNDSGLYTFAEIAALIEEDL